MTSTQEYWRKHDEECGLERYIQLTSLGYDFGSPESAPVLKGRPYTKYPDIQDYQMEVDEITESLVELNFDTEESLTFRAAVIVILYLRHPRRRLETIINATEYPVEEIRFIVKNLSENGILSEGHLNIDHYENNMEMFMEVLLCALCGAGVIGRAVTSSNSRTAHFSPAPATSGKSVSYPANGAGVVA